MLFSSKGMKRIYQGTGHYGTFGFHSRFKAASLKFKGMVALSAPGAFRKNNKIAAFFYFFCHCLDYLHGLPQIFPINNGAPAPCAPV